MSAGERFWIRPVCPIVGRMVNRPLAEIIWAAGPYGASWIRARNPDWPLDGYPARCSRPFLRAIGYHDYVRTIWIEALQSAVAAGEVTLAWK